MALQQDYTINLNYVLATDINADVEKSLQKEYVVEQAYFKVVNVTPIIVVDKPTALPAEGEAEENTSTIYLEVWDKEKTKVIAITKVKGFIPSNADGAENIIKQAYLYLKTTDMFKNSLNVLEKGQTT